jgi:hypothetical protein
MYSTRTNNSIDSLYLISLVSIPNFLKLHHNWTDSCFYFYWAEARKFKIPFYSSWFSSKFALPEKNCRLEHHTQSSSSSSSAESSFSYCPTAPDWSLCVLLCACEFDEPLFGLIRRNWPPLVVVAWPAGGRATSIKFALGLQSCKEHAGALQ